MQTIAAINQKGGVAKTTTALETAQGLSKRGYKVLLIDLDPQQNATSVLSLKGHTPTSLEIIEGAPIKESIKQAGGIDAIAADPQAASADLRIEGLGKEYKLKKALEPASSAYDFCIIDTPPALGVLTTNALTAADFAVIPAQADIFSLEGIGQLASTLQAIKEYTNPNLNIAGILLTRYNARTTLSNDIQQAAREAAAQLGTIVFDTPIREAIAIKEAQAMKQSIFEYAPRSKAAADMNAYIDQLLEGVSNG